MTPRTLRILIQSSDSGFILIGETKTGFERLATGLTEETMQRLLQQSIRHCHKHGVPVEVRDELTGKLQVYPVKRKETESV